MHCNLYFAWAVSCSHLNIWKCSLNCSSLDICHVSLDTVFLSFDLCFVTYDVHATCVCSVQNLEYAIYSLSRTAASMLCPEKLTMCTVCDEF